MVARPLRFIDRCAHGSRSASATPPDTERPAWAPLRRRLAVVTPDTAQAVRFAGGWLFDRVMDGWDVTVYRADEDGDDRPLRIIGARAASLDKIMAPPPAAPPRALAVHTDIYNRDPRVRRMVFDALDESSTRVSLWGDLSAAGGDEGSCSVLYRLSAAARAFKAQALAAAAVASDAEDPVERFVHIEPLRFNTI